MSFRKTLIAIFASPALAAGLAVGAGAPATAASAAPAAPQAQPVTPLYWACNWNFHNGFYNYDWWWDGNRWRTTASGWYWHNYYGYGCGPYWV